MFSRYSRIGTLLLSLGSIATASGQDVPGLARALERADRFDAAMGPKPQPVAKWLNGDRIAYSPGGKAPWTVLEASTARVLQSDADDAVVGGPGPAMGLPLGLASFGPANGGASIMPGQPHGPAGAAGRYYREDVRRFMATHLLRDSSGTAGRPVPE